MDELRIGVVGYCPPSKFDESEAMRMIREAYDQLDNQYKDKSKIVVSGLSNVGVLKLAYEEAVKRNWKTIGIACSRVRKYEFFPVDEKIIIGDKWGDESETFLNAIDVIIRIGGGDQSLEEVAEMRSRGKQVIEYNLPEL